MLIQWKHVKERCPDIKGIIHAGAHTGEEAKLYGSIPTKWIEADPELIPALSKKFPGKVYHFAASSNYGRVRFNVMPFKAANSVLEPNLNKRRSDVYVERVIDVVACPIKHIQEDGYNMIVMDIQGGELEALKGCDLSLIDYLLLEVHKVETYKDVPQKSDIDAYLKGYGFFPKITKWTHSGWGECLYIKQA